MVNAFMRLGNNHLNGFFPTINAELIGRLTKLHDENSSTILIGVSFALLDLAQNPAFRSWPNLIVIETGGMKGQRHELTRDELHARLKFHNPEMVVSSEYGMTELLSQAYWENGWFYPAPTMKIIVRDISDPLHLQPPGRRGAINVIDLANLDTCSFIATDDIGVTKSSGQFEVLGRLDQSDIRGCNLLYA
jgi:hypothetical protein